MYDIMSERMYPETEPSQFRSFNELLAENMDDVITVVEAAVDPPQPSDAFINHDLELSSFEQASIWNVHIRSLAASVTHNPDDQKAVMAAARGFHFALLVTSLVLEHDAAMLPLQEYDYDSAKPESEQDVEQEGIVETREDILLHLQRMSAAYMRTRPALKAITRVFMHNLSHDPKYDDLVEFAVGSTAMFVETGYETVVEVHTDPES
jgi:hypothetical protein